MVYTQIIKISPKWSDQKKNQISNCIKIKFNIFIKKILNFGYFKKWIKIHNKIVKFEIPNFERLQKLEH